MLSKVNRSIFNTGIGKFFTRAQIESFLRGIIYPWFYFSIVTHVYTCIPIPGSQSLKLFFFQCLKVKLSKRYVMKDGEGIFEYFQNREFLPSPQLFCFCHRHAMEIPQPTPNFPSIDQIEGLRASPVIKIARGVCHLHLLWSEREDKHV